MLKDPNLSSHTYREPLALEIYRRVPAHYEAMHACYGKLCVQVPG
jgi:hypothetical protein